MDCQEGAVSDREGKPLVETSAGTQPAGETSHLAERSTDERVLPLSVSSASAAQNSHPASPEIRGEHFGRAETSENAPTTTLAVQRTLGDLEPSEKRAPVVVAQGEGTSGNLQERNFSFSHDEPKSSVSEDDHDHTPVQGGSENTSKQDSDSAERTGAAKTVLKLDPLSGETSSPGDPGAMPSDSDEGRQARTLKVEDALAYLEQVKAQFEDRPRIYAKFLDIMKEFKAQTIDTPGVIEHVTRLFRGYPNLVLGFNTFLPAGYKIELTDCLDAVRVHSETPGPADEDPDANLGMNMERTRILPPYANAHTASIRASAQNGARTSDLENAAANAQRRMDLEATRAYQVLPEAPPGFVHQFQMDSGPGADLVRNVPDGSVPPNLSTFSSEEFDHAIQYVNKVKQRFQNQPAVYQNFLNILQTYQRDGEDTTNVFEEVAKIFQGYPDLLEEFKRFLPEMTGDEAENHTQTLPSPEKRAGSGHLSSGATTKRAKRSRWHASPGESVHARMETPSFPIMASPEQNITTAPRAASTAATALSGLSPISYAAKGELLFFEKLRERMEAHQFHEFIKCLSLYNQEIIGRTELISLADELFGHRHLLSEAFRTFLDSCAPVRKSKHPTDLEDAASGIEAALSILEGRAPISATAPPSDGLWRYKSLSEAAAESKERCDTSYKRIPAEYQAMPCSGRRELERHVLNDIWVSVPTGSEEGSFKHMRRNQFEDNLFRCEDDRYELDMVIETNAATIHKLEPLAQVIANMSDEEKAKHMLAEHALGAVHYRAIERVYGAHGSEMVLHVKMHPSVAVPVVLNRLKQKDEEWRRARVEMNKIWREICERNYFKSLDHRSFYFRQSDKKTISVRGLLQDIHDIADVKSLMEAITISVFAANIISGSCRSAAFGFGFGQPAVSREFEYSWRARQLATFGAQEVSKGPQAASTLPQKASFAEESIDRDPFAGISALDPPCLRFRLLISETHQDMYDVICFLAHLEYASVECEKLLQIYETFVSRFFQVQLTSPSIKIETVSNDKVSGESAERTESVAEEENDFSDRLNHQRDALSRDGIVEGIESNSKQSTLTERMTEDMGTSKQPAISDAVCFSILDGASCTKTRVGTATEPEPAQVANTAAAPRKFTFRPDSVVYGDETLYIFMRLYEIAYQRLAAARLMARAQLEHQGTTRPDQTSEEADLRIKSVSDSLYNPDGEAREGSGTINATDPFRAYLEMLRKYLSNVIEVQEYEDYCCRVLGPDSYVLFTLDKVLLKLVKQAYNSTRSKFFALYLIEKQDIMDQSSTSAVPCDSEDQMRRVAEASYCLKALQALRDERGGHLYRFESSALPCAGLNGVRNCYSGVCHPSEVGHRQLTITLLTGDEGIPRRRDTSGAIETAASYLGFFACHVPHHYYAQPISVTTDVRKLYYFERIAADMPLKRAFVCWVRRQTHAQKTTTSEKDLFENWKGRLLDSVSVHNGLESKMSLYTHRMVYLGDTFDELIRRKGMEALSPLPNTASDTNGKPLLHRTRQLRAKRWRRYCEQSESVQVASMASEQRNTSGLLAAELVLSTET
jgi:histone deacetylase complex regulatory component SIN3